VGDIKELIQKHTIKQSNVVKKICAPLKDVFEIPIFTYYTIEQDGSFGILSTQVEQVDFYHTEKLYLENPYMVHPNLQRSGYVLHQAIADPAFREISRKQFQVDHLFLKLEKTPERIEGFLFGAPNTTQEKGLVFLTLLDSLNKFVSYFKKEAEALIRQMRKEQCSLGHAKGELFFRQDPRLSLANGDHKATKFLKAITGLSAREQECLELFKQGESAQSTGAILGLSPRTVESYFESIKTKLGCYSKNDLLKW